MKKKNDPTRIGTCDMVELTIHHPAETKAYHQKGHEF
jgi:hypothetical protein